MIATRGTLLPTRLQVWLGVDAEKWHDIAQDKAEWRTGSCINMQRPLRYERRDERRGKDAEVAARAGPGARCRRFGAPGSSAERQ